MSRALMIAPVLLAACGTALAAVPSYTTAQATAGAATYKSQCAMCHGSKLNNGGAPHLAGADFLKKWSSNTLDDFYYIMSTTMPQTNPGGLKPVEYTNLLAYVLQQNGFKAGSKAISAKDLKSYTFKK